MYWVTIAVLGLLGGLFGWLVLQLAQALYHSLMAGVNFREALAERVGERRLGRMLEVLGIDRTRYLYDQPSSEILRQVAACDTCPAVAACDRALACDSLRIDEAAFCPNQGDLKRVGAD